MTLSDTEHRVPPIDAHELAGGPWIGAANGDVGAGSDPPGTDPAWVNAERYIMEQVSALTMWEAERWAVAYEHRLPQISLMAQRVAFLEAAGGSVASEYLRVAFRRIDLVVSELVWGGPSSSTGDLALAVAETLAAVVSVARCALASVVLADESVLGPYRRLAAGSGDAAVTTRAPRSDKPPSTTQTGR